MKLNEALTLACEKYRYCYSIAADGHVMLKSRKLSHTYPSRRKQRTNSAETDEGASFPNVLKM